jgi:hypothetical protein
VESGEDAFVHSSFDWVADAAVGRAFRAMLQQWLSLRMVFRQSEQAAVILNVFHVNVCPARIPADMAPLLFTIEGFDDFSFEDSPALKPSFHPGARCAESDERPASGHGVDPESLLSEPLLHSRQVVRAKPKPAAEFLWREPLVITLRVQIPLIVD